MRRTSDWKGVAVTNGHATWALTSGRPDQAAVSTIFAKQDARGLAIHRASWRTARMTSHDGWVWRGCSAA